MKVKKRILILDDNKDILDVLEEALTYANFEVQTTMDIKNFYIEYNKQKPDLVLIDYLLNDINGGEVCHQLKTGEMMSQSVPVIMMSGSPRVFESLGTYGCNEFLAKPLDLYTLIDKINGYMSIES